ncbi:MAG: hypothetical protein J0I10_20910 [Verrucomicrobia bacterium]|nr:hypothetical protein [Verrucomicrobiota bacterium]
MRIMKPMMAAAIALAFAGVAHSGSLEVRPGERASGRGAAYSAWGGDTLSLPVSVEGAPGASFRLTGTLFQVAGGLAAKVGQSVDLGGGVLTDSARREQVLEIPIPAVERPAQFVYEASVFPGTASEPASSFRADIAVWPKVEPAERGRLVSSVLEAAGMRLVVFGKSESLRDYLRALKVDFEDGGPGVPERDATGVVFLGDIPARESNDARDLRGRWIVVCDGAFPWPGVYRTVTAGADVTKICQPGFLNLKDDPAAATYFEKLLIDVIHSNATPIVP